MTDYLTDRQRAVSRLFLEGQGWGYGGSVDVEVLDPWSVPGRYGWVGGSGSAAHVIPATQTVTILLTQHAMTGPTTTPQMPGFWRYAAAPRDPARCADHAIQVDQVTARLLISLDRGSYSGRWPPTGIPISPDPPPSRRPSHVGQVRT